MAADKEFNRDGHDGGHPGEMKKEDDTKRHIMIGAGSIGTPPTPSPLLNPD